MKHHQLVVPSEADVQFYAVCSAFVCLLKSWQGVLGGVGDIPTMGDDQGTGPGAGKGSPQVGEFSGWLRPDGIAVVCARRAKRRSYIGWQCNA